MWTKRPRHAARAVLLGASLLGASLLGACEADRTSEAGWRDDGVSTAGPFHDGGASTAGPTGAGRPTHAAADLLAALDAEFSPRQTLGYGPARDALYAWENGRGGVCGLYTALCVRLGPGDPSQAAGGLGINAEHIWPQSKGARQEPLRSDLHHLFPERDRVNASRGNLPFGDVPDARADAWYRGDASQSHTPNADLDAWSERGAGRWEPREDRKGDVARAVFYVQAVYPDLADPTFFPPMRETLLAWNRADPPDDRERTRSQWVAGLQGTDNPFVLDPTLADQIWGRGEVTPTPLRDPVPSRPPGVLPPGEGGPPMGRVRITEIHYDNAGADVGEGLEVSGEPGTPLGGWALVLVNGADGAVYRTLPLAGALDGDGALWVPAEGLQNGSPDGVALLDPAGRTVEAWSWEGAFVGADETRFSDLGVAQGSDAAPGTSLQLVDGRWTAGRAASPGRPNR